MLRAPLALAVLVFLGCNSDREFGLEWSWVDGEVMAMPAVADLDGDGTPEVLATLGRRGEPNDYDVGALVALDGATGAVRWQRDDGHGRSTVAIGDVDGDARPDVIYAGREDPFTEASPIHAVDADGALLWTSHTAAGPARIPVENGAPALANLDDDPGAEIAIGGALLDHDGLLVWEDPRSGLLGSPHLMGSPDILVYPGSLATFVDLTGDGHPELLTGSDAWTIAWTPGDPPAVVVERLWQSSGGFAGDGFPAVADLDGDGTPEIVLVAWPEIRVLDGATGAPWCDRGATCSEPIAVPGGNLGGPATIADFDGDGRPEAAIATGDELTVFDFHRDGEDLVVPAGDPQPPRGAIYRRWSSPIQDDSSGSNGVAAFDFDGDGAVDLVHQDECHVRLHDGPTGAVLREIQNTSITIHEYPVVVDVDGDGATELVVAANLGDPMPNLLCAENAGVPEFPWRQGIYVYTDGAWPAARRAWTSHTHHLSNVDERGNAPATEPPAWVGRNSFRENTAP